MPVELRHWRAFLAAAELQHFGRAAERLGISQPALSQLVQALETQLGAPLFDRTRRRVELTSTGAALLPEARATLEQARRAEQIGSAAGRQDSRMLTGGYVGSAALHPVFGALMRELAAIRPAVTLQLDQRPAVQQLRELREHVLDFGIARSPLPGLDTEIAGLVLAREPMVLAVDEASAGPAGVACRLADVADRPFIQYLHQSSGGLRLLTTEACRAAGFEPRVAQTVPQIATMLCLVAAGLGVALVPQTASRLALPGVTYRRLSEGPTTELHLLYRRSDTAPAFRALVATARRLTDKTSLS
ncbi:LysR substrate-binding domain-containing protein [Mangrovibrevibacter kandeliae]|uniref:LysR substrate-binding domain-containing protein n=1 Tax=Mangrovibrevibacter kandeliae TaxID=2968473 RepID=UPI002118E4E4|nr:LysR substrate-binding domain-containing protein [Aurantimonas sp. CSK15Z-1]MCQ8782401.1 LysR substrate-binding domain-containing protein [Aurantimonas sp. CSK15Z-1]